MPGVLCIGRGLPDRIRVSGSRGVLSYRRWRDWGGAMYGDELRRGDVLWSLGRVS